MNKLLFPLVLFAAITLAGCASDKKQAAAQPETVRDVAVAQVARTSMPDLIEAVGTVRAAQTAQLSAETVGTVREVRAVEGQRVKHGEVLVLLDDAQQRAAADRAQAAIATAQQELAAAEADNDFAQATLKRYETLREKRAVSPHEFDEVQAKSRAAAAHRTAAAAGLAQARAAAAQAEAMFSYTRIRAPFDGVVTAKNVDPGALAAPGTPLLTVEDTRKFRLEATVDESELRFVRAGAAVAVNVDALPNETTGKVAEIVPAADPASRSFVVKIELAGDSKLRSGLFGRAQFTRGIRDAIVAPRTAIVTHGQLQGVYVIGEDRSISLRYVTLGKAAGERIEILSGLNGGERLVTAVNGRELAGKKLAE